MTFLTGVKIGSTQLALSAETYEHCYKSPAFDNCLSKAKQISKAWGACEILGSSPSRAAEDKNPAQKDVSSVGMTIPVK
ncbi:MAG: hypothetical protein KDD53_05495 [Bdellovibrionales bacterium]|nr:hypothetical protein [Bdellovibrionales bacterium]